MLRDTHNSQEPPSTREECCDDGLLLPDPFLDYITCPQCGEPEVELWCFEESVACPICRTKIEHHKPVCFGSPACEEIQQKVAKLRKQE